MLTFDTLELKSEAVVIAGQDYRLREANEEGVCAYRAAIAKGAKATGNAETDDISMSLEGIAYSESVLVSVCLYNGDGKQVPLETVRSWPHRVVAALYTKAEELSGLGKWAKRAEAAAKN